MEKFMQRENVQVGLSSSARGPSSDDVDFNDVFGGPPRRFSMQEPNKEKARLPWVEKPIFGEESGPRRRQQRDDFFDDIFRGSKENDRDGVFGSGPGSRIMSPVRPFSPKTEPFGTSLPTQFSLPAKFIKTVELPPFGSNINALSSPQSSSPSSRFSSQSIKGQDHKTRRNRVDSYDSPLADESFHFSIYKWAGWEVPVLLPGFLAGNSLKSKKSSGYYDDITMELENEVSRTKSGVSVNENVVLEGEKACVEKKVEKKQVLLKKEIKSLEKEAKKPLRAFLHCDEVDQKPKPEIGAANSRDVKNANKHEKKTNVNKVQHGAAANSVKSSVSRGKVKEFVQIFNQNETQVILNAAKDKEKVHEAYKKSDVSLKVDMSINDKGSREHSSKPVSTNVKKNISSESFHKESKVAPENLDDSLEDNFMVQELSYDHEKVTRDEGCEDTKTIDAKIQQWSFGKKGNIRSLLSTLQCVLWSGSGWNPVPLVDLIETNSVKRAYQKALLRLHPDKLQQKGAAFHQKYIAEKVFDILQEAWDHFNSSSINL
ncbi:chaperone DnaJ-domain superfamily protein [Striga asiatica]|uniref:Chaperone DnaJ-domain superfamily protein n=1 Tax=Striga asiatica TaxID=4170 RepID=A0A5A7QSI3_STRAF|nr:chaperone DnaJ-domain superfamily protein [Striga asiatica]